MSQAGRAEERPDEDPPRRQGADEPHVAVDLLLAESAEFADLWRTVEVGVRPAEVKRFVHPEVGPLSLQCQTLLDREQSHRLLVHTAEPGSPSADNLRLLAVIGRQSLV